MSVGGSCSVGEQEETSLDIQVPLHVLFIAHPLQLALSSAFHCLKRDGKQRERKNGRVIVLGRERLRSMKRYGPAPVWAQLQPTMCCTLLSDSCSAQ